MPDCYIVVVPPNAPETLAYLTESFNHVPDIEIVVNRRRPSGAAARPIIERRAPDDRRRIQEAFGCTLVRIPRASLEPALPAPQPVGTQPVGTRFGPLRMRSVPAQREG